MREGLLLDHTAEPFTIKYPFIVALLLGVAGFAGNWLHVQLLFSIDLLFGGIFVMLVLQFCGLVPSMLAVVLAGSATVVLWNHPYSLVVFTAELLVTGLLYQRWRGHLMLANTVFWIALGMPLTYVLHQYVMHLGYDLSLTIMFKQAINGIANAIAARMLFIWLQGVPRFRQMAPQPVGFQERITTLLALFVMATALTLLSIESINDTNRMREQIISLLSVARRQAERVAQAGCEAGAAETTVRHLTLLIQANAAFERVSYTLYDKNNRLIASNRKPVGLEPPVGGQITHERDFINHWKPEKTKNTSFAAQWKKSRYFTTLHTSAGTLLIQTPTAAWMPFVLASTIKTLVLTLLLFIVSLLPGVLMSRHINRSLLALGQSSSQLPEKIALGTQPEWPSSSIPEMEVLIGDLQRMAVALGNALSDKQTALKRLLAESTRREVLEELLIEQRQQERLRISRALHDEISQALQAIKLNLQVQAIGSTKDDQERQAALTGVVRDIEKTLSDLRTVVVDLRKADDSRLRLSEALPAVIDKLGTHQPTPVNLHLSGAVDALPKNITTAIFFIAQEAISNAVKHACADTIKATLMVTGTMATLEVRDDGCGNAESTPDGAGITIMQERARLAGGTLVIVSPSGGGTTIRFEVPLS